MSIVPGNRIIHSEDGEDDITTLIRARARICMDRRIDSKRTHVDVHDVLSSTDTRVLLRRVYFLNEGRTSYISVGFYPTENYQVLAEFGG